MLYNACFGPPRDQRPVYHPGSVLARYEHHTPALIIVSATTGGFAPDPTRGNPYLIGPLDP